MSHVDSHDPGTPGYFLPEDSQSRLKHLRDHIALLSRLARPRTEAGEADPAQATAAELGTCLALVAEQADLVLSTLAWWPGLPSSEDVPRAETSHLTKDGYACGITLDQIDVLGRLVETLSAHGDVVASSLDAEFAAQTVPLLGQAICDGTQAVRDLLDQVEAQGLRRSKRSRAGVGETRAVYGAACEGWVADDGFRPMVPAPNLSPRRSAGCTHH